LQAGRERHDTFKVLKRKKTYNQDWEAWNNFTEVTPISIWKDEGRFDKRRKAPQEGGTARARV